MKRMRRTHLPGTWRPARGGARCSCRHRCLLCLAGHALAAPAGFSERFADVNGTRLRYLIGGKGSPVVLLHGYAQTGHMWRPIMPLLAEHHTVIVPDLRGAGGSAKPESGYDKKNMARGHPRAGRVAGPRARRGRRPRHRSDGGLRLRRPVPAGHRALVLMDAFLPGIGDWKDVWLMRDLWHFHFYGKTPLALVEGRERIYFEHFWNDFAADPQAVGLRGRSPALRRGLRSARRDARRLRVLPQLRAGREGLRAARRHAARACRCWC